jgi:hypothetical protein
MNVDTPKSSTDVFINDLLTLLKAPLTLLIIPSVLLHAPWTILKNP